MRFEFLAQREAIPTWKIRRPDGAGVSEVNAGDCETDGGDSIPRGCGGWDDVANRLYDLIDGFPSTVFRGGDLHSMANFACRIDDGNGQLGAADVYGYRILLFWA